MDKMNINGIVLCPCGGQLISNTGKIISDVKNKTLYCWICNKSYPIQDCYDIRQENKTVTYDPQVKKE